MIDTPTSGANSSLADEDFLAANKARKQNIGDSTYSLNSNFFFVF